MKLADGVAYGSFRGYAATFFEGLGHKDIVLTAHFSDKPRRIELKRYTRRQDLFCQYGLRKLVIGWDYIHIRFQDSFSVMKRIRAFCDWFMPQLAEYGVLGADLCPWCGDPADESSRWLLAGKAVRRMHDDCAAAYQRDALERLQRKLDKGSYLKGFLGALAGCLLGLILWVLFAHLSFMPILGGLAVGLLSSAGYHLFRGKTGRRRLLILGLMIILAAAVGNTLGYTFLFMHSFAQEGTALGFGDSFAFYMESSQANAALRHTVWIDLILSACLGLLGAAAVIYKNHKRSHSFRMKELA